MSEVVALGNLFSLEEFLPDDLCPEYRTEVDGSWDFETAAAIPNAAEAVREVARAAVSDAFRTSRHLRSSLLGTVAKGLLKFLFPNTRKALATHMDTLLEVTAALKAGHKYSVTNYEGDEIKLHATHDLSFPDAMEQLQTLKEVVRGTL
jgi:hypothetical protein